jgi:hypothetical protein
VTPQCNSRRSAECGSYRVWCWIACGARDPRTRPRHNQSPSRKSSSASGGRETARQRQWRSHQVAGHAQDLRQRRADKAGRRLPAHRVRGSGQRLCVLVSARQSTWCIIRIREAPPPFHNGQTARTTGRHHARRHMQINRNGGRLKRPHPQNLTISRDCVRG